MYGLIDRAFLLSHSSYYQKNIEFVVELFLENGYSLNLIFEKINSRIKTLIYNNRNFYFNNNLDKNNNSSDDMNKKVMFIPYIKKISESVTAIIDKSKYITGFRVLNNLGRFIKIHKDSNNLFNNNNVVYKISCRDCNASYVGQTKRQLKTRIKEHCNNYKLLSSNPSVVTEHMLNHSHSFDWTNVKILNTEADYCKRLVSEMLHIKEQSNGLNAQKDTELLDNSYFEILDMLSKI